MDEEKDGTIEELGSQLDRLVKEIEHLYNHISYPDQYPLIDFWESVHRPYREGETWMPQELKFHWTGWLAVSIDAILQDVEDGKIGNQYASYILRVPMHQLPACISAWNKRKKGQNEL